jgi:hypothetical protein
VAGKLGGQWLHAGSCVPQLPNADDSDTPSCVTQDTWGSFWSRDVQHVPACPPGHGSYLRCPCTGWRPSPTSTVPSSAPCQALQVLIDDPTSQVLEKALKASQLPLMSRPVGANLHCAQHVVQCQSHVSITCAITNDPAWSTSMTDCSLLIQCRTGAG